MQLKLPLAQIIIAKTTKYLKIFGKFDVIYSKEHCCSKESMKPISNYLRKCLPEDLKVYDQFKYFVGLCISTLWITKTSLIQW